MTLDFRVGDTIRVHQKIQEGEKTRAQIFEGIVLKIDNNAQTFTVRKVTEGIGVERIWPFVTPWVEKIEVKKRAKKVIRAKLYHLRNLTVKETARVVA